MADFCLTCSKKIGLPEPDIKAPPGEIVYDCCEGCGTGWFNENGQRVADESADE
jgi:hypothetical protein